MSRLEDLNIRLMVEGPAVSIYVRDNCIAAVGGPAEQAARAVPG